MTWLPLAEQLFFGSCWNRRTIFESAAIIAYRGLTMKIRLISRAIALKVASATPFVHGCFVRGDGGIGTGAFRRCCPAARRNQICGGRRSQVPLLRFGKWRPGGWRFHNSLEGGAWLRCSSAFPHRGRTVDRGARRGFDRNGRDVCNRARARRLRDDARQEDALVHVRIEDRMFDVVTFDQKYDITWVKQK